MTTSAATAVTGGLKFVPRFFSWEGLKYHKWNICISLGTCSFIGLAFASVKPLPSAHYALVVNRRDGKVKPGRTYDGTEVVFLNPFTERIVVMRRNPIRKRFIKEFKTSDGKSVEVRILLSLQPRSHWLPEVYSTFGVDFGRSFLEREATLDVEEVCKHHSLSDLLYQDKNGSGEARLHAIKEIQQRLADSATYHKIDLVNPDNVVVDFLNPESDLRDEY